MILRELREIDQATDDILVYGFDGTINKKILTNTLGQLDIVNVNLDIALSDLKTVLDAIDANTDTLEAKTQSIRDQLDVKLSTRSSESTAIEILNALGQESGTDILTELQNLVIDLNTSGLAQEDTLIEVRDLLTNIETELQTINSRLDVDLSTRSSEDTLLLVKTAIDAINVDIDVALSTRASESTLLLVKTTIDNINSNIDVALSTRSSESTSQSILSALGEQSGTDILTALQNLLTNTTGLATEATLALIKTAIESIDSDFDVALSTRASESTLASVLTELESIDSKDFATETTLALMKTAIDAINADIDVALSTRASEVTLALVKTALDTLNASIDVNLSTRASENTVQAILDTLGTTSGITLLSELVSLANKDFATETTLALMKIAIDAINADIDVALSTRASESTLDLVRIAVQAIDTDIDVALSTRSSEATLLLVKTNLDDIKTKLDTLNSTDFSTEVTSQAILDALGTASGTDIINQLQCICDTLNDGIEVTIPPSATNQTIELVFDQDHIAPNKFQWQEVLEYTIPTGFDLNAVTFDSKSDVSGESARVISKEVHGSFDSLNDIYTDSGIFWSAPKFGAKLYVFVTTAIGAGANDNITITYVNQDGIAGRIGTVIIPKSSVVGTRLKVTLEGDDRGIRDVTNVTHSELGQAGEFDLESVIELFYLTLTNQGIQYQSSAVSLGGIVVLEDETLFLQYESNSATSNNRRVALVATLVEKSV